MDVTVGDLFKTDKHYVLVRIDSTGNHSVLPIVICIGCGGLVSSHFLNQHVDFHNIGLE